MTGTSSAVEQARELLEAEDYDAAIELLTSIGVSSAEMMYALADAYFLKFALAPTEDEARLACRTAMKLYLMCYEECSDPRMACLRWVQCARMFDDEKELIRAKEAGLEHKGGVIFILYHYILKRQRLMRDWGWHELQGELEAVKRECDDLLEEAFQMDPDDPNVLIYKASSLTRKRKWKEAYELQLRGINRLSNEARTHPRFPHVLACAALLALIVGEDMETYLEWARELDAEDEWVTLAEEVKQCKRQAGVKRAKELLSGERVQQESMDSWLADDGAELDEVGQKGKTKREPDRKKSSYTSDIIEQMTPEMREELIVELLAKGIRGGE